jgi:hypothetical protein
MTGGLGPAVLVLIVADDPPAWANPTRHRRYRCAVLLDQEKRERARVCKRFGRGGRFCLGDKAGGPSIKMDGQGSLRASGC